MKYGFLTIMRTPLKTAAFFLLIAAVMVFLSLGAGMRQSSENMLDEADKAFSTIGEFTFTGGNYPDNVRFDEKLSAAVKEFDISAVDGGEVNFIEENITQRAFLDGFSPVRENMPYAEYSLITINVRSFYEEQNAYSAIVEKVYYSSDSSMENKFIYISDYGGFEQGGRYAVFGYAVDVPYQQFMRFEVISFDESPFSEIGGGKASVYNIADYGMIKDFTESEEGALFSQIGETLNILNNSVDVVSTDDIKTVYSFHSGEYKLAEGRYFNPDEKNVCVISKRVAGQLNLSVGDSINLNFHYPTGEESRYASYLQETGFIKENAGYIVTGIYQTQEPAATVFIPNGGQEWLKRSDNDYVLARVSLDNRRAENYIKNINGLLPDGVSFKVNDQGYKAAVMSVNSLRETSMMIILLCAMLCVLILWFFGFLFIYRSENSAKILLALGAGKKRVIVYFLTGSGVIAGAAAAAGVFAGYIVSDNILGSVYESIKINSVYDFRYSIISYGINDTVFNAVPETNAAVYILTAAAITFVSLLFCLFFTYGIIKKQDPRRRFKTRKKTEEITKPSQTQKVPKHVTGFSFTALLPSAALRYSIKSIVRGGKRSFTVPVLFAAMLIFISVFHSMHSGLQKSLETVYEDIPVTMRFSDISGKKIDGLNVTSTQTDKVNESGFTDKEWKSYNRRFMFNGTADSQNTPEQFEMPSNVYSREIFMNQWNDLSEKNVFLPLSGGITAFEYAAEFVYADIPEIEWAENFSETDLFNSTGEVQYLIASDKFLEKYGLSTGNKISAVFIDSAEYFIAGYEWSYGQTEYIIAGSYKSFVENPITYTYIPDEYFPAEYEYSWNNDPEFLHYFYNAAGFLLKNTDRLSEFKDRLEQLADPLGKGGEYRIWAVIDDAALYDTIDRLRRYIDYMNMLYPVILAVVAIIGFLISHLLLKSRTAEIAVLRGLGASKFTVFFSYFNENLLLSFLGAAVGLVIIAFIGTVIAVSLLLLALCYYAGLSAAIIHTYRKSAIEALSLNE